MRKCVPALSNNNYLSPENEKDCFDARAINYSFRYFVWFIDVCYS